MAVADRTQRFQRFENATFDEIDTTFDMTVDTTKAVSQSHVLQRMRIPSRCLVFAQSVLSFSAAAVLSGRETRTGWAHTFGVVTALLCGLEGLVHVAVRAADLHMNIAFDIVAVTTCVLSYAGVVGLVTNTEDNQHPVPVDAVTGAFITEIFPRCLWTASLSIASRI